MAKAKKQETKMNDAAELNVTTPIAEEPPTGSRKLIIQGNTFQVPSPYREGHVLTAGEASAFNQLFADNMRNAFNKKVAAELAKTEGAPLTPEAIATIQADLDAYAASYSFDSRTRARAPRAVDAVERKLQKLAEQTVVMMLNQKGYQRNQLSKENFAQLVQMVIEKQPELREEAQRAVEVESRIAQGVISTIGNDYPLGLPA